MTPIAPVTATGTERATLEQILTKLADLQARRRLLEQAEIGDKSALQALFKAEHLNDVDRSQIDAMRRELDGAEAALRNQLAEVTRATQGRTRPALQALTAAAPADQELLNRLAAIPLGQRTSTISSMVAQHLGEAARAADEGRVSDAMASVIEARRVALAAGLLPPGSPQGGDLTSAAAIAESDPSFGAELSRSLTAQINELAPRILPPLVAVGSQEAATQAGLGVTPQGRPLPAAPTGARRLPPAAEAALQRLDRGEPVLGDEGVPLTRAERAARAQAMQRLIDLAASGPGLITIAPTGTLQRLRPAGQPLQFVQGPGGTINAATPATGAFAVLTDEGFAPIAAPMPATRAAQALGAPPPEGPNVVSPAPRPPITRADVLRARLADLGRAFRGEPRPESGPFQAPTLLEDVAAVLGQAAENPVAFAADVAEQVAAPLATALRAAGGALMTTAPPTFGPLEQLGLAALRAAPAAGQALQAVGSGMASPVVAFGLPTPAPPSAALQRVTSALSNVGNLAAQGVAAAPGAFEALNAAIGQAALDAAQRASGDVRGLARAALGAAQAVPGPIAMPLTALPAPPVSGLAAIMQGLRPVLPSVGALPPEVEARAIEGLRRGLTVDQALAFALTGP